MKIVNCEYESHGKTILYILNEAIATSTALYDYEPRTLAVIQEWFNYKQEHDYPIIGIENENGILMGFATYGTFRAWDAYKYSVEHSLYVDVQFRGKGAGKRLLTKLVGLAQRQNYHTIIGGIDADNKISIALHRSLGFVYCGTIKQAGFKFNRWLDLEFYQLILPTPVNPTAT